MESNLALLANAVEAYVARVVDRHVQRRGVSRGGVDKMTRVTFCAVSPDRQRRPFAAKRLLDPVHPTRSDEDLRSDVDSSAVVRDREILNAGGLRCEPVLVQCFEVLFEL